jgi:multiple sugar transport system permease protein
MNKELRNFLKGMAFLSPWIIGFVLFMALPIILSFYYSLSDYRMLQKPVIIDWLNYKNLAKDEVFGIVLKNTLWYAAMALPAGLIVSLGLALLLNVSIPGQAVFRTIIFLPSLAPAAASAMVWLFLLNSRLGLVNNLLDRVGVGIAVVLLLAFLCSVGVVVATYFQGRKPSLASRIILYVLAVLVGIELILEVLNLAHLGRFGLVNWGVASPAWLEVKWVLRSFAIMSLWGVGNTVVIYLAGLQDVPKELYEAAEIDGANNLRRLWHVTIPMLSPVIFFNLIMAIIGTLQNFTGPQLITQGGPDNASRFFSMYVYDYSFTFLKMGYASAMAWIQLLLVLALTALAFWSSKRWVHYQGK